MKIIYALHRDRNGGKYVHYNEDFCKKSSGGSHESRYILWIFSKDGLSKDLYSKVYKTCRIRISEGNTRSALLCTSGVTIVDKMDQFFGGRKAICRHNSWSKLRIFCKAMRWTFTVFVSAVETSIKGYVTRKLRCGWTAIKGGDRPTRLSLHAKMMLVIISYFSLLGRLCSGRFYIFTEQMWF